MTQRGPLPDRPLQSKSAPRGMHGKYPGAQPGIEFVRLGLAAAFCRPLVGRGVELGGAVVEVVGVVLVGVDGATTGGGALVLVRAGGVSFERGSAPELSSEELGGAGVLGPAVVGVVGRGPAASFTGLRLRNVATTAATTTSASRAAENTGTSRRQPVEAPVR